jgi:mycofactocin precursor
VIADGNFPGGEMADTYQTRESSLAERSDFLACSLADASSPPVPAAEPPSTIDELVLDDLLVEDVSIDGMCGVY